MANNSKIEVRLKSLPNQSGVYLMKNQKTEVIYVGKAKYLSKRVRSYFNREHEDIKTRQLVENIADIEWIVTDNEIEALMLETNLIKKHRPRYNVLMKDDKNYVYLKITNEDFPRVLVVRKVLKDGAKYFGPYTNATNLNESLRLLNRIFPFFTYRNKTGVSPMDSVAGKELFAKRSWSVWGYLTDRDKYQQMMNDFVSFVRGNTGRVLKIFKKSMNEAAVEKDFEKAAMLRDRIGDIEKIAQKQKVITPGKENIDVIGIYGKKKWVVSLIVIRDGKMLDLNYFSFKGGNLGEVVSSFVKNYYPMTQDYPRWILLPVEIEDDDVMKLPGNVGERKISVIYPQKGQKKQLVELASKNAKLEFVRRQAVVSVAKCEGLGVVELLHDLSNIEIGGYAGIMNSIDKNVFRLEGYDISNLGDKGVVGAMVVWELYSRGTQQRARTELSKKININDLKKGKGGFNKKMYRRFEIKSFTGQDDFGAMREVLDRRFKHKKKDWPWPNLVLLDGGKGQLSTILQLFMQKNINVPVIALAKQEEELWLGEINDDGEIIFELLELDKDNIASLFLQSVRNEVHRYVLSYQRMTRKKQVRKSVLDSIVGLGPKKKKLLLKKFGSVKGVVDAGEEVVGEVVGKKLAKNIFEIL